MNRIEKVGPTVKMIKSRQRKIAFCNPVLCRYKIQHLGFKSAVAALVLKMNLYSYWRNPDDGYQYSRDY